MNGVLIYQLNHDVRNIIELMLFCNRMKHTNEEYHQMFYFFDTMYYDDDQICPNPRGRCVAKYIDVKIHWLDGKYHRKDGPAFEWANGGKSWYVNDQRHREDGPAIEYVYGDKAWYVEGRRHRLDGPAIEYADDRPNEYWKFGNRIWKEL